MIGYKMIMHGHISVRWPQNDFAFETSGLTKLLEHQKNKNHLALSANG